MKPRIERERSILGVEGRAFAAHVRDVSLGTFSTQTWKASREYQDHGQRMRCTVELRFDDNCGNGHNTFAATCDIERWERGKFRESGGGADHDTIARIFPELAPLLKWHLVSSDGPMHYLANTIYLAGDRDHNGLLKGERRQIRNGKTGALCWVLRGPSTQYFDGPVPPSECVVTRWEPLEHTGEGKVRELGRARSCAVWPEATDEQLSAPRAELEAMLLARLPQLIADFRADTEACGFEWSSAE